MAVLKCADERKWLTAGADHPIILYTDHISLKTVLGAKSDAAGRIARWNYFLQQFKFIIQHVPGKTQIVADGLSRLPHWSISDSIDEDGFNILTMPVELSGATATQQEGPQWQTALFALYRNDPWYHDIVTRLLTFDRKQGDQRYYLVVKDGVGLLVYREKRGSFAECIRAGQVPQALFELHDIHGHYSTRITLGRALGKYYWPNRYRDIEKYC